MPSKLHNIGSRAIIDLCDDAFVEDWILNFVYYVVAFLTRIL